MNPLDELLISPLASAKSQEFIHTPAHDWTSSFRALRASLGPPESRSKWSIEWAIHRWANERLVSAAIRIGKSEGLSGPPPARWRILAHIEEGESSSLGFALAILGGRASLEPSNVIAVLVDDGSGRAIAASRGHGLDRGLARPGQRTNPALAKMLDALSDPAAALPKVDGLPDALAFAVRMLWAERDLELDAAE